MLYLGEFHIRISLKFSFNRARAYETVKSRFQRPIMHGASLTLGTYLEGGKD